MSAPRATRRAVIAAFGIGAPLTIAGAASAGRRATAEATPDGWRRAISAYLAAEGAIKANNAADAEAFDLYHLALARDPKAEATLRKRYGIEARLRRDDELGRVAHDRLNDLCRYPVERIPDLHEKAEILAQAWGTDDHDAGVAMLADIRRIGGAA